MAELSSTKIYGDLVVARDTHVKGTAYIDGWPVWTHATLTNNNQLANGAGYVTGDSFSTTGTYSSVTVGNSTNAGNADTLDTLHAASFLRSDANDSFTGIITGDTLRLGGSVIVSSTAKLQVNGFMRSGNIYIHEGGNTPTSNANYLGNTGGVLEWGGNTVFHAGTSNPFDNTGTYANVTVGNATSANSLSTARSIALTGDVTGSANFDGSSNISINATVGNDSHTHTFANLTSKTSGTGDYSTNGDLVSGRGSGGVALTINDGQGNANVTFNHQNGTPEQNGNSARIVVNTDSSTGANFSWELKSGVTGGTSINTPQAMTLSESGLIVQGSITGTSASFSDNVALNSGADLRFVDQNNTYPTTAGGFEWVLNNDGASISANQPSSDAIDLTFKIKDNVSSNDRFVFHVDNYLGAANDIYPLIMSGVGANFGVDVGIGQPNPSYKLDVNGNSRIVDSGSITLRLHRSETTSGNAGLRFENDGADSSSIYGVSGSNYFRFFADADEVLRIPTNKNVVVTNDLSVAGIGYANGFRTNASTTNYTQIIRQGNGSALYVNQTDSTSTIAVFSSGTATANSNIRAFIENNGTIEANDFRLNSDRRLKSDIQDLHSIDLLRQLQPKSFYKNDTFGYGFIAQDIQELVPSMVGDSGEYLSLRQTDIIALNTSAIQYLDSETDQLKRRVQELEDQVRQLGGSV